MNPSDFESWQDDPEVQQLWEQLDGLAQPPEVSGQFEARVWARLEQESQTSPVWLQRLSQLFEWLPVPALALMLLVLSVFWSQTPPTALAERPIRLPLERSVSLARQFPVVHTADLLEIIIRYQRS